MKSLYKYLVAAAAVIALSVTFFIDSFKLQPAGYMLPRILIIVLILLSIAMIIEAYVKEKKKDQHADDSNEASGIDYKRAFIFGLLIFGYIVAIKPIGYFIVTPIYVILSYLYLKATNLKNMVLIAVIFTAFVYLLFVIFLKLPIPLGPMS